MLGLLEEMNAAVTALETTMESVMITGGVVQPMVDAVSGNRNVKQPLEDAVADVKIKNSWDTKRKNIQTARKRQINLRVYVKKCGDDGDGFFIDNISINNLVQCAMCTPKLAMRRSEGMMLNMST